MKCSKTLLMIASAAAVILMAAGCNSDLPAEPFDPTQRLTAGQVKMTVKVGKTSQNEIFLAMGSPNMVAMESGKGEIWTYDQIKVRRAEQGYQVGAFFGTIFPFSEDFNKGGDTWNIGSGAGGAGARARAGVGTLTTSVNTATLIVRFDANEKVASYKMLVTSF